MKDPVIIKLYNNALKKMKNTVEDWEILIGFISKIYSPENKDDCLECINLLEKNLKKRKQRKEDR